MKLTCPKCDKPMCRTILVPKKEEHAIFERYHCSGLCGVTIRIPWELDRCGVVFRVAGLDNPPGKRFICDLPKGHRGSHHDGVEYVHGPVLPANITCACGQEMWAAEVSPCYQKWLCNCGSVITVQLSSPEEEQRLSLSESLPNPLKVAAAMPLREELAAYAHEAWSGWMKYMFSKCCIETQINIAKLGKSLMDKVEHNGVLIPGALASRWMRQMNTHYCDLPEKEKESDLAEADKMLEIMGNFYVASTAHGFRRCCNTLLDHLDARDGSGPTLTLKEAEKLTSQIIDKFEKDFDSIVPRPEIDIDASCIPVPWAEGWNACREEVIRRLKLIKKKEETDG